jgi:hypothetical protein
MLVFFELLQVPSIRLTMLTIVQCEHTLLGHNGAERVQRRPVLPLPLHAGQLHPVLDQVQRLDEHCGAHPTVPPWEILFEFRSTKWPENYPANPPNRNFTGPGMVVATAAVGLSWRVVWVADILVKCMQKNSCVAVANTSS